jgi:hypothetical protein
LLVFGTFPRIAAVPFLAPRGSLGDRFQSFSEVLRVRVARFLLAVLVASPSMAATALFPKPLHLVRRVEDAVTRKAEAVDEYCYGNRIITVRGKRVSIADYAAQQLTTIDHEAGTYSVTPFDEIAKAANRLSASRAASAAPSKLTAMGMKGGRDEYQIDGGGAKIEVTIDRKISLSRDAVEALLGAAYPNTRRPEHDALLRAAAGGGGRIVAQSASEAQYGLPAEQTITYSMEGATLTFRTAIVRTDADLVPQELLLIPPGASRVESRITRIGRELQDIESLPARKQ